MSKEEIKKELGMTYAELVKHLLAKYGSAKEDYFLDDDFKTKNPRISRTSEGLYCHHIDEDKEIMLSVKNYAKEAPFEYQLADRLVYCNILEHLLLHIKITEEPPAKGFNFLQRQGRGGAINIMIPQINDYYNGYEFKREYLKKAFSLIKNNYKDYIEVLKHFYSIPRNFPSDVWTITKENLSRSYKTKEVIDKIYKELKPLPYISDNILDY